MDRDDIRKMIQANNLTRTSSGLFGVMVRTFGELCDLDEQLEGCGISEKDLQRLMRENAELEQAIVNANAAIVQAGKDADAARKAAQERLDALLQKGVELDGRIRALEDECSGIRQKINGLADKPSEMKRLKGKLEELQARNSDLQKELDSLGEDYQERIELHGRLTAFVEKLESLEEKMSETMNEIWKGLKKDAFDRMCVF